VPRLDYCSGPGAPAEFLALHIVWGSGLRPCTYEYVRRPRKQVREAAVMYVFVLGFRVDHRASGRVELNIHTSAPALPVGT
jgi:hypothetical protein